MRRTLRAALIGAGAVLAAILVSAFAYRFVIGLTFPNLVQVEGRYLQLACEYCPHVEVEAIEPEDHDSLVGEMIFPQGDTLDVHEFMTASLLAGQGRQFCLGGRLHRFTGWWPLRPAARPFAVQSITVGACTAPPAAQ